MPGNLMRLTKHTVKDGQIHRAVVKKMLIRLTNKIREADLKQEHNNKKALIKVLAREKLRIDSRLLIISMVLLETLITQHLLSHLKLEVVELLIKLLRS